MPTGLGSSWGSLVCATVWRAALRTSSSLLARFPLIDLQYRRDEDTFNGYRLLKRMAACIVLSTTKEGQLVRSSLTNSCFNLVSCLNLLVTQILLTNTLIELDHDLYRTTSTRKEAVRRFTHCPPPKLLARPPYPVYAT